MHGVGSRWAHDPVVQVARFEAHSRDDVPADSEEEAILIEAPALPQFALRISRIRQSEEGLVPEREMQRKVRGERNEDARELTESQRDVTAGVGAKTLF